MKKLFTILSFIFFPAIAFAQFSGAYYIGSAGTKPGGGDPNYLSLKSACDALNAGTVTGDCTFYITSDLTEPVNIALGVDTKGFTITFKPSADISRTITFTATLDNGGASGGWLIGSSTIANWSSLTSTSNIVIDGYADGSMVKRLILKSDANAHTNTSPITILGNTNNIVLKNCIVSHLATKTGTSNNYAVSIRAYNDGGSPSKNYLPKNITVENCDITANSTNYAQGIGITNKNTPTSFPSAILIKNNTIIAKTRGVFLYYAGNTDIMNNTISVNQNLVNGALSSGVYAGIVGVGSTVNISNNKFVNLLTSNTTMGDYGIIGIWVGSNGTYNVNNNFIAGINTNTASANGQLNGIRISTPSTDLKVNIQHNTIMIPDTKMTTDSVYAILISNNVLNTRPIIIRNNIITCQETNAISYLIYRSSAVNGLVTSDYNDLYSNTSVVNTGYWDAAKASLSDWQTASGNDIHSVSEDINFISGTDLHLGSSSYGNTKLIGCPISEITTDIDGDTRNASYPYMGADEIPGSPLPVELTSFTALGKGSNIELKWNTATEVNTLKFEIERKSIQNEEWIKIGEIKAHGNSNAPKEYSFTDNSPLVGKNVYRLKMIDNDGSFEYSSIAEVNFAVSQKPDLLQNYPNPFNPETVIRFSIPEASTVSLKIYNSIGEEVAELVNGHMNAGIHNVTFDASNLASGVYLYKLQTENFVKTMKMQLVK